MDKLVIEVPLDHLVVNNLPRGIDFDTGQWEYIKTMAYSIVAELMGGRWESIVDVITPDIMDDWNPPAGLFPNNENDDVDYMIEGAGTALSLAEIIMDHLIKLAKNGGHNPLTAIQSLEKISNAAIS